jgi:two-component system sensor histidine kinase MtrB
VTAGPLRSSIARRPGLTGFRGQLIATFLLVAAISAVAAMMVTYVSLNYLDLFKIDFAMRRAVDLTLSTTEVALRPLYRTLGRGWFLFTVAAAATTLLVSVIVSLALLATRRVLKPIGRVSTAARRLAAGQFETRLDVRGSDELADLLRSFNEMAAALQHHVQELRTMESRARRFAADVSHELRTPLTTMTAVADLLDEESRDLSPDAAVAASLVSKETRSLTRLVDDLVEISRFDAGTAALVLDEVDLASAVQATLRARGWTDQVSCPLPADLNVRVDPRRLDVIVANLVGNALRHGAPPVAVHAWLDGRPGTQRLTVEVRDHGPGLAPEVREHVFDRFYKADAARTRSEGSGLGLFIARENALLHGGDLRAGNLPTGGAVFTLVLPAAG